jgi:hypothetical protein
MSGSGDQRAVTLVDWKPLCRNALCGFACLKISRIKLHVDDVAIHQKNRSRWAPLPSKAMLNRDGDVSWDEQGKVRYQPAMRWGGRETVDRFSSAVIAELTRHPDAFAEAP